MDIFSSYSSLLFNPNLSTNANPFLFQSFLYPPPLLYSSDPSIRIYHETFVRSLLDQYSSAFTSLPTVPPIRVTTTDSSPAPTIPAIKINQSGSIITSSISSSVSETKIRRRLTCSQCAYSTNRLNNLKRHVQTMHEILSEPIDCCEQLFTSKAHFRAHVNSEHRCGYHCDICQRTFCRKALLRRHQSIHSGQKAFLCRLCSYSTSHKGNLDRHARIHRQEQKVDSNSKINSIKQF